MDIKLKNKKSISIMTFILALFMMTFLIFSSVDWIKNNKYLDTNYYFKTKHFNELLKNYYSKIIEFHEEFKDYEKKSFEEKVDKDLLENEIELYEGYIYDQYANMEQGQDYSPEDVDKLEKKKEKELQEFRAKIKDKNSDLMKKLKKNVVSAKDKKYSKLKLYLKSKQTKELRYYIQNKQDGTIYTNLEGAQGQNELEKCLEESMFSVKFPLEFTSNLYEKEIDTSFKLKNLNGYFMVITDSSKDAVIMSKYRECQEVRNRMIFEAIVSIITVILTFFIFKYLRRIEFFKNNFYKTKKIYNNISMEFKILIFLIISYFYKNIMFSNIKDIRTILVNLFIGTICLFYFIIVVNELIILVRDKDEFNRQWQKGHISKIKNSLKDSFIFKNVGFKITIYIFLTIFLGIIISAAVAVRDTFLTSAILYSIFYVVYIVFNIFKCSGYFNKILCGTEKIILGDLDYVIEEEGKGSLNILANNINNIKNGYKKSLENSVKSERLKSELITNVSHDLKTPLTSIINYVNLLKDDNLSKEEISAYVSVLDRKSQRLKDLIEDLMEASKVTSGSIELNIEKVDIVALIKQALGEYDEKIKNSSLIFKVNLPNNKVFLNLDGKRTWRVFHNLISNVLKYSQPNTRVYLDLQEEENQVIVVMKNISSYEMDFKPDEIFERFKRGDKSRSTEGSGLGLAIAKSIVELQGGTLNVVVDGDLFKIIIKFIK